MCAEEFLVCGEGDEQGNTWMEKVRSDFITYKNDRGAHKLICTNSVKE